MIEKIFTHIVGYNYSQDIKGLSINSIINIFLILFEKILEQLLIYFEKRYLFNLGLKIVQK